MLFLFFGINFFIIKYDFIVLLNLIEREKISFKNYKYVILLFKYLSYKKLI